MNQCNGSRNKIKIYEGNYREIKQKNQSNASVAGNLAINIGRSYCSTKKKMLLKRNAVFYSFVLGNISRANQFISVMKLFYLITSLDLQIKFWNYAFC